MNEISELNITYLLGAGASAKALPIIKKTEHTLDMSSAFRELSSQITKWVYDTSYSEFVKRLQENLLWLAEGTDKFGTPDTFAKYLYLKNDNLLNQLKITLAGFFVIEQIANSKFDNRSLIFLTTIMQESHVLPRNIKILSWNYDCQIQLAAEVFKKEKFSNSISSFTHSLPIVGYFPPLGYPSSIRSEEISLIQLNGIAGYYYNSSFQMTKSIFEEHDKRTINNILEHLTNEIFEKGNILSFAWEKNLFSFEKIESAKKIAIDTDIFVIIGYSFPFFNRKIDKEIFEAMKMGTRLKKIYYQDPFKNGDFLKNQFELSEQIEIRHIKETDNYFIPMEL